MIAIHTLDCIDPFDWWCILAKIPKQHQPSLNVSKHITARCLYMHHIDTNSTMNNCKSKITDKHVLSTKNEIQTWLCMSWHTPNHANNQFSDCDCHLDRTWTWTTAGPGHGVGPGVDGPFVFSASFHWHYNSMQLCIPLTYIFQYMLLWFLSILLSVLWSFENMAFQNWPAWG